MTDIPIGNILGIGNPLPYVVQAHPNTEVKYSYVLQSAVGMTHVFGITLRNRPDPP